MLAGQSTTLQYLPQLPELKEADPVMDKLINMFVLGQSSPTRITQFSEKFKSMFAAEIRAIEGSVSVVNQDSQFCQGLGFAAHRFGSLQKPLSCIPANHIPIAWERKGSDQVRFLD